MTTYVRIDVKVDWMHQSWSRAFAEATRMIEEMRDWCIITLDVGAWEIDDAAGTISGLTKIFTFDRSEDATAFKIRFGA
jgi:uncharacterized protein related to proFAR isomerase